MCGNDGTCAEGDTCVNAEVDCDAVVHVLAVRVPLVAQGLPAQEIRSVIRRRRRVPRLIIAGMISIVWATEFVKTLCAKSRVKMMRPVRARVSAEMMVAALKDPIVTTMVTATANVCASMLYVPMGARRTMSVQDSKLVGSMDAAKRLRPVRPISTAWVMTYAISGLWTGLCCR